MKSMNLPEVRSFAEKIGPCLKGAQLQEILTNDQSVALGFYLQEMLWLWIDLSGPTPLILFLKDPIPFQKSSKPKPLGLFLKSNAHGMKLMNLEVLEKWGRVLRIELGGLRDGKPAACELEIHLIPKHANMIVRCDKKNISWERPQELKERTPSSEEESIEVRSLEEILEEWQNSRKQPVKTALDPVAQWERQRQKDIDKKLKALAEIKIRLEEDRASEWYALGEHLKTYGHENLSEQWSSLYDSQKNLSWNIENSFGKAKQIEKKREGTLERVEILEKEIETLRGARFQPKAQRSGLDDLMKSTEAKGRKLNLENGMIVYLGRSAADNLALLRKAKAWDFWFHLKDYPGAHAIVHRLKDQDLSYEDLQKVARWVAQESLSSKNLSLGQKLAVVYVECRFVRPIKGDKLGRVTYHSEKNTMVSF